MQLGSVLADRFVLEALIATGGMGAIYRALDLRTGSPVALKTLQVQMRPFQERFVREANILAELTHPCIVKYVAHGTTPVGTPFIAMEWFEGEDVERRLGRVELTVSETIVLGARIAGALAAAHARGVVHRDIKPANLFLPGGKVEAAKLIDFGIARTGGRTVAPTIPGVVMGTPGYMAPEQARGAMNADHRVDVFALGCVLYRCLGGVPPFAGNDLAAILAKLVFENATPLLEVRPSLPSDLCELVAAMMSKSPDTRPGDCAMLAKQLVAFSPTLEAPAQRFVTLNESPTITRAEQRLVSVVVIAVDEQGANDEGIAEELGALVKPFGGEIAVLASSEIVATIEAKGTPIDQAAQAARCAMALRAALPSCHVVLATGRSTQGHRVPLGEAIDRAVHILRSMRHAGPSSQKNPIRVDDVTAGLLDHHFEIEFEIGDGEQVTTELIGEREQLGPAGRTLLGKVTPCVGRERELGLLEGIYTECVAEPVARIVLVTAPPGIGKSRLRYEFLLKLAARQEQAAIIVARGDPLGAGAPFRMLSQAVRRVLGVHDDQPPIVRRQIFRTRLSRNLSGDTLNRVSEFLGELCGIPFPDDASVRLRAARRDPVSMGDQIRRALEDFVAAECAVRPVVLVLDDLHWGDLPTIQWVDAVVRNLHDKPLLVLALGRPEIHDQFPNLWTERAVQMIRLFELSKKASEKFVRAVLGERTTDRVASEIVERAAGNAFFLEEMLRAVVEGHGQLGKLPESVLAIIQTRIDRLDTDARRVLRAASVFGQVFWTSGVAALLGGSRRVAEVRTCLSELCAQEVVTRRNEGRFQGEEEFTFRHALVRDAAYAMLTGQDRTLGHHLAGSWLERVGETDAVVLAAHFELGADKTLAGDWYLRAAEQALEANDFLGTIERARRALDCGVEGRDAGEAWFMQAEACKWLGRNVEAQSAAKEAMTNSLRNSARWLSCAAIFATMSSKMGHHEQLKSLAIQLHEIGWKEVTAAHANEMARVAIQYLHAGKMEIAADLLEIAERMAHRVTQEDPTMAACVHQARAVRAMFEGDVGAYTQLIRIAVDAFERAGDLRSEATQRVNLAHGYMELGAYDLAERELRDVLPMAERMGLKDVVAGAKTNLGITLARGGALEEARAVEMAAVRAAIALANRRLECGCRTYLSTIALLMGDVESSEREARAALEILAVAPPMRALALGTLGRALLAQGRAREAIEATREALTLMLVESATEEGEALVHAAHIEAMLACGLRDGVAKAVEVAWSRLATRAALIRDPVLRESFMTRVVDNARITDLAREWLSGA